jgi:predicted enzyme related to lactoylglutathione lyase
MANPFSYLELHSTDAARARAFYTELFDWKTSEVPVPVIGTYTEIDTREGLPAGMMTQQQKGAGSAWLPYVRVPSLDEAVSRAQKLGGKVVAPRGEVKDVGWFAVVQDPSGAAIGLFEKTG